MNKLVSVALTLCLIGLASALDKSRAIDTSEDLKAEESRQRIYDIIHSHEGRKYGVHEIHRDHGGHEYENGEVPLKLASKKQYGYLPYPAAEKTPVYYDAPKAKDNVYRENVAAYAAKAAPVHLAPNHALAKPVTHSYYTSADPKPYSQQHYAVVHPKSHSHQYMVLDPKPQYYSAVHPKSHNQYVSFDDQKHHPKRPLVLDHKVPSPYILEPEPEYVDHKVVVKPAHVPHYSHPVKDYSLKDYHEKDHHSVDKGYQSSGHGYHGDNSVHGESGHKAHKNYEIADHKEHSTKAGHHDEHDRHHNKAHYERDRGYHYEKAYAYDRIRAHHDIGSDKGSHTDYHANHGQEGHKESGDHGSQSHSYFKKNDQYGGHEHHDKNTLYKGGHKGGQGYHDYQLKYLPAHPYGK